MKTDHTMLSGVILHNQMQIMAALVHSPNTPPQIRQSLIDALANTEEVCASIKTDILDRLNTGSDCPIGSTLSQVGLALRAGRATSSIRNKGLTVRVDVPDADEPRRSHRETWERIIDPSGHVSGYRRTA